MKNFILTTLIGSVMVMTVMLAIQLTMADKTINQNHLKNYVEKITLKEISS